MAVFGFWLLNEAIIGAIGKKSQFFIKILSTFRTIIWHVQITFWIYFRSFCSEALLKYFKKIVKNSLAKKWMGLMSYANFTFMLNHFWQKFLTILARPNSDYPSEVEFWKNIEKWLRYRISAETEKTLSDITKTMPARENLLQWPTTVKKFKLVAAQGHFSFDPTVGPTNFSLILGPQSKNGHISRTAGPISEIFEI